MLSFVSSVLFYTHKAEILLTFLIFSLHVYLDSISSNLTTVQLESAGQKRNKTVNPEL